MPLSDLLSDYHTILNCSEIFKKFGILININIGSIHVSPFFNSESSLFYQMTSLTNGYYSSIVTEPFYEQLLSFNLDHGVPIVKPNQQPMKYTLPCVCHQKEIINGIAYSCSLCLSVYCRKVEECSFCHAKLT